MPQILKLTVNGDTRVLAVGENSTLAEVLRENLGLTGTKQACGEGACGACTVLLNGTPTLSCLTLALAVDGAHITTIEGVGSVRELDPIQEAFVEHGAIQCGMCTPAMVLTAKALLDTNSAPTPREIREAISGIVCRCTGYTKIVEAIEDAARHRAGIARPTGE